jgi:hypothetical protein
MLKQLNKLNALLVTLFLVSSVGLVGCVGDKDAASTPSVSGHDTCGVTKDNSQCSLRLSFNKYHHNEALDIKVTKPNLDRVTSDRCRNQDGNLTPEEKSGCGIIMDGTFKAEFDKCREYFKNNNDGTCEINFNYTPGISGDGLGSEAFISLLGSGAGIGATLSIIESKD